MYPPSGWVGGWVDEEKTNEWWVGGWVRGG